MQNPVKTRWGLLAGIVVLAAVVGIAGWHFVNKPATGAGPTSNSLLVIAPYYYNGTWVFDDPAVGLRREPFVAGVPEMIDLLVKNIPDAKQGFRLTFSANPFPGHQKKLTWLRGDSGGNYYKLDEPPMEGWLCPGLFKYFRAAPPTLYVKAEAKGK